MSVPVYMQPEQQSQPRQSNRRFWGIAVGLMMVALIALVAFVGLNVYWALNLVKQNGPIPARYYMNIINSDYSQAYSYLDSNATIDGQPVNQQAFINKAKSADSQYGTAHGFVLNSDNDASHITVTVSRGSHSYTVHLVLKLENGSWKIVSADGI